MSVGPIHAGLVSDLLSSCYMLGGSIRLHRNNATDHPYCLIETATRSTVPHVGEGIGAEKMDIAETKHVG